MKILIVSDSYPPEVRSAAQLMVDLAEGLASRGHEVTVATTMPGYNLAEDSKGKNIPKEEAINSVRVVRVETLPHHRVNYIFRGINQLLLSRLFTHSVLKILSGPFDVIIVHSPPLPLALSAALLAKRFHARFIANIHDIFPQNAVDLLSWWQKPLVKLFFAGMERKVYTRADLIVVPSKNHMNYLFERRSVPKEKLKVIPHWIDVAPYDTARADGKWRKAWGLEKNFIFFFGGVLGPSQGLDIILDVAEYFRSIPDVKFLFVGDGTERPRIESIIREKKLDNVILKPFVSNKEYPELVKEMDVGVITLTSKNTTPAVPAKLMGYMAAGIPVVVVVHKESDALRIVEEAHCGFSAVSNNHKATLSAFSAAYEAHSFLKKIGGNGRRYLHEYFNKEKLVIEWEKFL